MNTKHTPTPWTVYRCGYCEPETACGLNGTPFDCANDECHHPLDLADAEFIVRACNSHDALLAACKKARTCSSINSSVMALLMDAIKAAEGE